MFRIVALAGLTFATLGGAFAGTVTTVDLAQTEDGYTQCTGCTVTSGSVTTSDGGFLNAMFSSIDTVSSVVASSSQQTPADSPVPFILDSSGGNDIFNSTFGTNQDVGILIDLGTGEGGAPDIGDLYTMMEAGNPYGYGGITITATGVASDGITPITDTIDLTSGVDYRSTNSKIQATCTDANPGTPSGTCTDTVGVNDTTPASGTDSAIGTTTFNNVFGAQANSNKNFYLDVQELQLSSAFANGYLDSVFITYNTGSTGTGQISLEGLTLGTALATPEPGTLFLVAIGFGLVGFWRIRSRRTQSSAVN